uniref:non-specific serine/threonine protein kinase n=2 Tax=Panagrellus redivivus TaxID=6233 RepID=A0A7E5A0E7_PANRE
MGELIQIEPGRLVNGWKIEKKLGEGAFGAVYKCSKNDKFYAFKVEGQAEKIQLLKMEVLVLLELTKFNAGTHFCKLEDKGQHDNFNFVVMTLVGKSLQDLRLMLPKKKFSMGTAISVSMQCLKALEDLHSIGYLHRDVKPGNYTIGRVEMNELRKVYVLDFGMARKFVHDDGTMKKPRTAAGFRGTVRYAALSCHLQRELCRKDDIESWLYQTVELTKGKLPWRNLEDQDEVGIYKKSVRKDPKALKQLFGGCPRHYIEIMDYINALKFYDNPEYAKIYALMKEAMVATKSQEFPYDWEAMLMNRKPGDKKPKKKSKSSSSSEDSKKKKKSKRKQKRSEKEKKDDKKHADDHKSDGEKKSDPKKTDDHKSDGKKTDDKKTDDKKTDDKKTDDKKQSDDKKDSSDTQRTDKKPPNEDGSSKKSTKKKPDK